PATRTSSGSWPTWGGRPIPRSATPCGSTCTSSSTRGCPRSATATCTGSGLPPASSGASTRTRSGRASPTSGSTSSRAVSPTLSPPRGRGQGEGDATMRRMLGITAGLLGLVLALAVVIASPPAGAQRRGGVRRVGVIGEPPALDAHWTTATITSNMSNHLYEGLYTLDEGRRPIPMLAESLPAVSRDGLTYTIKLRQGIKFHNGKELGSEDVVASLKRWGQQSVYGRVVFAQTADVRAVDRYTVELRLKERSAVVVISLAVPGNFAAIYPKEVAEKFKPQEKVTEFVGTGPFKFAEWKPDQYIRFVRFDDYRPRSEKGNGYGGSKTAYVDEIRWIPVPDVATRVAQIETGELDFVEQLNIDAYDRLARNAAVRPVVAKPQYWLVAVFNKKEGPMTRQKLRQAWQTALDLEPIMRKGAGGRPGVYPIALSHPFHGRAGG